MKLFNHFINIAKCLFLLPCLLQAQFLERKAEGWHYHESLTKKPEVKKEKPKQEAPLDPSQQLKLYKKEIDRLKDTAVMDPTYENVKAYMEIQKEFFAKSSNFARRWMEVVYTTPELDYSLKHPTSQAGRHVYLDQQKNQMDGQVAQLSKTHGLFFFFSSSCAYCKSFAPIVKAFSQKYGWDVVAISTDGSTLEEFPDAVPDNGIASKLGVQFVPTLLAVNPTREQVIPLSYGMSSQEQIIDRIRVLIIQGRQQ